MSALGFLCGKACVIGEMCERGTVHSSSHSVQHRANHRLCAAVLWYRRFAEGGPMKLWNNILDCVMGFVYIAMWIAVFIAAGGAK